MRREDPNFRVFGAEQHQYQLGPTLSNGYLDAFEHRHQVRLPADYRLFLREAGNGGTKRHPGRFMGDSGAGPYYGLLTLEDAAADSDLSNSFPLIQATKNLADEELERCIDPDRFPGVPGALALCHQGSGIVSFLVVNGPTYGTMWEGREDFFPTGLSFDAWYRRWMDRLVTRALPVLANERAAARTKVGMTMAQVINICGGHWKKKEWGTNEWFLSFDHLATQFELNEQDVVVRKIEHCIS